MSGWIKLHRSIKEHWLYKEKRSFSKFEAWNDILLTVNYCDAQTIIKGKIYNIKRGQSILSLDSWSKRWNWDKSKVRRFLKLLQSENMIVLESDTQTTQLTVCKYDTYQGQENEIETKTKRKRNANETQTTPIKEEEEIKEEKEIHPMQKYVCDNYPIVSQMKTQLTYEDCIRLNNEYDSKAIKEILDSMENYKDILKKNSVNLTIRTWIKRNQLTNPKFGVKQFEVNKNNVVHNYNPMAHF